MRKTSVLLVAAAMLVSTISGCSGNKDNSPEKKISDIILSDKQTATESKYDDGLELCIASYDVVKDFKADKTGKKDATDAINQALISAQIDGGGTVYIPEGKYLVTDVLSVPSNVVLRGEWESPNKAKAASSGTILIADNDSAFKSDPVIYLDKSSGIQNLTIIYPNQNVSSPVEYYYSVEIGYYRCFTMENLTVLGAWDGVAVGSERQGNEIYYLHNVYVSALHVGVYNTRTSDTGRYETVECSPHFWMENTLYPMNGEQKKITLEYFRANAHGFEFYYNDWSCSYDIVASDMSVGVYFALSPTRQAGMNGKMMNVELINCDTGIFFEATKLGGVDFTNIKIQTDWNSTAGIDSSEVFSGTCSFLNAEITGPFKYPVRNNGVSQSSTSGTYEFVSSKISGYDSTASWAVTVNGGSVTMQQCELTEAAHHLITSEKIQSVSMLGCTYGGTPDMNIPAGAKSDCDIDDSKTDISELTITEHKYIENTPKPASTLLVNVTDYGANVSSDDNTGAFNKALESLRATGGTVYIPAGNWRFKGELTVPSGVELRGCCPVQQMQNTDGASGTILWIYSGKGDEDKKPFITLEAGSGVLGFCTYYPEQYENAVTVEYPWTVQSTGESCWAVCVSLTNSYNGIDFGTHRSNGFYIDFVGGSPVRRGIFVGTNDGEGWMQNCQFNPNYAFVFSRGSGNEFRLYYCDAFIAGYVEKLHAFGLFEYGCKNGMLFISQNNKKTNGNIIHLGIDGTETSLRICEAGDITFVNPQLTAMESINDKHNIYVEDTFTGKANFYNSTVWGPTNYLLYIKGGSININLMNICTGFGEYALYACGGNIKMNSTTFHNTKIKIAEGTESVSFFGCYTRGYKYLLAPTNESSAKLTVLHSWWA